MKKPATNQKKPINLKTNQKPVAAIKGKSNQNQMQIKDETRRKSKEETKAIAESKAIEETNRKTQKPIENAENQSREQSKKPEGVIGRKKLMTSKKD